MPVGVLASAAAASGIDVEIFATFWGLVALRKDMQEKWMISKEYSEMAKMVKEVFREGKMPSWVDMLRNAKELGNVKVYACSMTYDMFEMKMEDLIDIVDGVVGAGEYLLKAKESDITLFI
jgi:peroxiredoxin family protein